MFQVLSEGHNTSPLSGNARNNFISSNRTSCLFINTDGIWSQNEFIFMKKADFSMFRQIVIGIGLVFFLTTGEMAFAIATPGGAAEDIGKILPFWTVLPFMGILLSIALCPLLTPHFWHNHFGKVSAFWGLLFALPFLFVHRDTAFHSIVHIILTDILPYIASYVVMAFILQSL